MATLTIEMIRKRAEHNDGVLHSLEELSLNQLGLINLGVVAEEEGGREETKAHHRQRRLRRRSLLPRACRKLRHLSLAGNSLPRLPCGPRDLGLCKELKTLNIALNAIERIAGVSGSGAKKNNDGEEEEEAGDEEGPLSSCESLQRLDLSGNFVSTATVREAVRSLASAPVLESLWLSGCPVAVGWEGYRRFVVGSLPRLKELDGVAITAIERIEAAEALPELRRELVECERQEREEKGGDESGGESDASWSSSEIDLRNLEREADLLEEQMKMQQEATRGKEEAKMPWSRAARLLLARETAAAAATAGERGRGGSGKAAGEASSTGGLLFERAVEPVLTAMPPWSSSSDEDEDGDSSGEGEEEEKRSLRQRRRRQRDDGSWPFALYISRDGAPLLVLEVALGLSGSSNGGVELDVRPRHVRVFAGGSLLCARLPGRVDPDRSSARRSLASGTLVVEMPLADPAGEDLDEACVREWGGGAGRRGREKEGREVRVAAPAAAAAVVVVAAEEEEDDDIHGSSSPPPLLPQKSL